ncbi:COG1361 S-layer family protein [Haladaptatus sp. CMAA 1911]|uniref:COG1361 S-layer family protein n=1 Tax=unclassified Haladaptatus TaxID=2622732 RepID=UPI0037548D18
MRVGGVVAAVLVCATLVGAGMTVQQTTGASDIDVFTPEKRVTPGEETQLPLVVTNDGSEPASAATLEVGDENAPLRVLTDRAPVGTVPPGTQRPVSVRVRVGERATPGEYTLPVRISYDTGSGRQTVERYVTVRVERRPRFRVVNTTVNASAGETGTLSLAVRNAGTVGAFDASVVVNSTDSGIRFGNNATTAETSVGEWLRGDTKYVEFPLQVAPDTDRNVTAQVRVAYESRTGERRLSEPVFIGVRPEGRPSFAVRDVRSTVRVGDTGTVSGRVVNTGNRTLDDATLVFTPSNGTALRPEETRFPLGRLRNNSSRRFRFEVDATNATNSGPRDFTARITYRDASGARRVIDPVSVPVRVGARREPFVVTATDANFTVDSSGTLRVRVRNTDGKRFSNVTARLLVSDPLSSDDSESYVGVLEPNDSTTASFQLTVSGEAIPDRHPVAVAISYETPSGERREAGPYAVPVTIRRESGLGSSVLSVGAVVVVLLLGVAWWLRRR